jgi:hypothetical protein
MTSTGGVPLPLALTSLRLFHSLQLLYFLCIEHFSPLLLKVFANRTAYLPSSLLTMSGISKACCSCVKPGAHLKFISILWSSTDHVHSIPPVVSKGYQAKGAYKTINGLKTCRLSPYETYDTWYKSDRFQMLPVLSRPRRLSWSCTVSCYLAIVIPAID